MLEALSIGDIMDFNKEFVKATIQAHYKIINEKFVVVLFAGKFLWSEPDTNFDDFNLFTKFEIKVRRYIKDQRSPLFPYLQISTTELSSEELVKLGIDLSGFSIIGGYYKFVPKSIVEDIVIKLQKASGELVVSSNIRQEKSCKSCGKMNDLGINVCWWCETNNPTS